MRAKVVVALAFVIGAGSANAAETVTVTGHEPSPDICLKIATAKYQQWLQASVGITHTKKFANGRESTINLIVTPNTVFVGRGAMWGSGNITIKGRGAGSPELVQKSMGLVDCTLGDQVSEAGHPATTYTYSQLSDWDDGIAQGTIWIANDTGLPLRQEMAESIAPKYRRIAAKMSASYAYNDEVHVPDAAASAEMTRLFNVRASMTGAVK